MALPVILIDSATGSDSAASGAGPSTALTGTSASTDGAGTLVTLDGSPDLTNVATDGSHVIYLADTTAGARNFGKITAKDNAAKTVTVANAFGVSLSGKSWAIGGKRASLLSTTSGKLLENNSAAGDAMPGWILRMSSGHTESTGSTMRPRRAGDTTSGRVIVEGVDGAATLPVITATNNGDLFVISASYITFRNFEMRNTNATKTASRAIAVAANCDFFTAEKIKISHSTDKFWKGILTLGSANNQCHLIGCEIGYTAAAGVTFGQAEGGNAAGCSLFSCWVHDCVGGVIYTNNAWFSSLVYGNLITANTGIGLSIDNIRSDALGGIAILHNTFDSNTTDNVKFITAALSSGNSPILNNEISNSGGSNYGINFSAAGFTDAYLSAVGVLMRGNNFYANGTKYNPSTISQSQSESTSNPTFTAGTTGGADYSIGTPLKALGYPTSNIGTTSNTRSYVDIGAAQRQEAGGGVRQVNVNGGADQ